MPKFHPGKKEKKFANLDKDGVDLLNRLIALKPEERISAENALNHPYFYDVKK